MVQLMCLYVCISVVRLFSNHYSYSFCLILAKLTHMIYMPICKNWNSFSKR